MFPKLLQSGVVVAVTGAVAWYLLNAVQYEQEYAEKMVVEATIRNMNSGMQVAMSHTLLNDGSGRFKDWVGGNPVSWLEQPPPGYLGEVEGAGTISPGTWGFDRQARAMLYRPKLSAHLEADGPDGVLSWRVEGVAAGSKNGSTDWLRLVKVTPYRWFWRYDGGK